MDEKILTTGISPATPEKAGFVSKRQG